MIIVMIRMTVPEERRSEIFQTVSSVAGLVRKEQGCRACNVYINAEDPDAFLLIEEWDAQEEFDRHVRTPVFSALLGAMTLLNQRPDVRINNVVDTAGMEKITAVRAG
jgi:quinol monooxygenase YgiN